MLLNHASNMDWSKQKRMQRVDPARSCTYTHAACDTDRPTDGQTHACGSCYSSGFNSTSYCTSASPRYATVLSSRSLAPSATISAGIVVKSSSAFARQIAGRDKPDGRTADLFELQKIRIHS